MLILGIESSCDETAAAIVRDGRVLLSNVVQSQVDIHAEYGGVVPEVAARSHIEVINPVIRQAMQQANVTWDDVDAIAVANAPGLIGSLLVGCLAAATLAKLHNKPLYPVHHVEGHIYANFIVDQLPSFAPSPTKSPETASRLTSVEHTSTYNRAADVSEDLLTSGSPTATPGAFDVESLSHGGKSVVQPESPEELGETRSVTPSAKDGLVSIAESAELELPSKQPTFPMLALAVSGLHSQLVLFECHGNYQLLGETLDDAVGEAFDKVAKILGLPYPGGPSITKAALHGDPKKHAFPRARLQNPYDFSFSGLKTAVLRAVQRAAGVDHTFPSFELSARLDEQTKADFAASFQHTAVKTLVDATEKAVQQYSPASVVIAGGVAANSELRRQLSERLGKDIDYAPIELCTDNGAMIAALGYYQSQVVLPTPPEKLQVHPSVSMRDTPWALPSTTSDHP